MSKLVHLEAEQSVLGMVLVDNATLERVTLAPEHFSEPIHADLWRELQARRRGGQTIDNHLLRDWAANRLGTQLGGGANYLMTLMERAAPLQVRGYADLLRDLSRRRAIVVAAQAAIETAASGAQDAEDTQAALEMALQSIAAEDDAGDAWKPLGSVACDAIERAELGELAGVSTGIAKLDELTGGLKPTKLWVAAGATSMGKSLLGAFFSRAVGSQGLGVGECHLEMDDDEIGLRAASAIAFDIDHRADNPHYLSAQRGKLRPEQWETMRNAAKRTLQLPIYVDARPGRSVSQIEAAARRLFRRMQREGVTPGALLIDHEGLIAPEKGERFGTLLERASARGEALKGMAKRLNVPVIALAQLTNEGSRIDGTDDLPSLTQIRYGAALTQAADVVLLLHRKAYYAERKPASMRSDADWDALKSREATLVADKVRGGQRGTVSVLIDTPTAAVVDPRHE